MDMPIHPGDPLSPGWASEPGGKKLTREDAADDPEDSGAADLVRRRAAAAEGAEGTGRAGRLARRAADHVSRRAGPGAGAREARVRLAVTARSTTSSSASKARRSPTSGSSSAIITTRG